jgi:serralysin
MGAAATTSLAVGDDRLLAGKGGDVLIGEAHADRFIFGAAAHSKPSDPDTILDFSHDDGDRIDLRRLDADLGRLDSQKLEFLYSHAFTDAGRVRQRSVDGHTVIEVNLDDYLRAELVVHLSDAVDLHRSDFLL